MRRFVLILASIFLLWGCVEKEQPMVTLGDDQSRTVEVAAGGGSFDVTFASAMAWTSEIVFSGDAAGWASIGTSGGEGSKVLHKVKVTVKKNDSDSERSAKVLIVSGTASEEVVFTQPALQKIPEKVPVLQLTDGSAEIGAGGGRVEVTVQFNVPYECKLAADWVREVKTKSFEENVHVFEVDVNTVAESRSETVQFCGNNTCIPFTITQEAAAFDYKLAIDTEKISVSAEGTQEPVTVNVNSNLPWSVVSDADWCTVSPGSGENDGSFSISVGQNVTYDSRVANVTVTSDDGAMSAYVQVVQSPVYQDGGDDSWKTAEFLHVPIAFRFTADWCGYCPMMARAMTEAQKELDGRLEVISVHGGGSGLECDESLGLMSQYSIPGFPTGLVDCRTYIENSSSVTSTVSSIVAAVKDTEEKYDTYTGLGWNAELTGNNLKMDLSVYVKKAGEYKVTVLLIEDGVVGYQADYINGNDRSYEHSGIIRGALSDVKGDQFTTEADGMVKHFTYSEFIPSDFDLENMRVVVYVQKKLDQKKSYYADNTASAPLGEDKTLETVE